VIVGLDEGGEDRPVRLPDAHADAYDMAQQWLKAAICRNTVAASHFVGRRHLCVTGNGQYFDFLGYFLGVLRLNATHLH
jgi:hypothetical protein